MKRSVINKGNRNAKTSANIPASKRRAINKKKVSSHQDNIVEKLARMCITPSESHASQAVIDKAYSDNRPKASHKKRSSKKSSTQGVVTRKSKTTFKEYEHGFAPVVPPVLYDYLQDAVCSIKRLETHKDDRHAKVRLEKLEDCIKDLAYAYKHILPKNWEYGLLLFVDQEFVTSPESQEYTILVNIFKISNVCTSQCSSNVLKSIEHFK